MADPRRPTNPTVQQQLHNLELQFVEFRTEMMGALRELRSDLSDAGRSPNPVDRAGTSGRIILPATWTPMEVAKAALVVIPVLLGIWGVSYSGAQSGGNSGATTAVETAVEQAEAIPVAPPPTIRVVPMPVPMPPEDEDPAVASPPPAGSHDLMPDLRP